MKLLDFLKGEFSRHVGDIGSQWTPKDPSSRSWPGSMFAQTAAGIPVNPDSAMNSATAFACTRAIAETLASLPAVVYENLGSDERQKARQDPMWTLLHDQPNPEMDSMSWYELNTKRVVNRGNSLNLIEVSGRGLPKALWPIHNSRWEARRRSSTLTATGMFMPGELYYRIWPDETSRYYDVSPEDVLNIVGFDSENGIIARGVVSRARQEIALDVAQQEYSGSMFKNGALPLGLIKMPWIDDDTQRDNFRADINSLHTGRENWNRVGILWDKDADWKPLNFNPKDVQAIESRTFTAKTLCRYYGVPPAIVQIFDDYKFASVEAMLKQFVMLTIRNYAVRFERAVKSQVLGTGSDIFLEFSLEGLLRGDPKAQAETAAILRQWGIINANEYRQRELNMNGIGPEGDAYLAPLNYGPLDKVAAGDGMRSTSRPAPRPPAEDDEADDEGDTQTRAPRWDKSFVAALAALSGRNGHAAGASAFQHAQRVIDRQYARMLANEANGIRRLASKGVSGFIDRLNEFYEKFEPTLAEALAVGAIDGDMTHEARTACEESKELLLDACGCQPEEFAAAIDACLATWPSRQLPRKEAEYEPAAA